MFWSWIGEIWRKARRPVDEILAHCLITIASILTIALIELLLTLLQLDRLTAPFVGVPLSEVLYDLDAIAAVGISAVGVVKGVMVAWRS